MFTEGAEMTSESFPFDRDPGMESKRGGNNRTYRIGLLKNKIYRECSEPCLASREPIVEVS